MSTSCADVAAFCSTGGWRTLADKALRYLDDVQPRYPAPISWALGGGTRLMLEFQHRISDDIDVFIPDPNVMGLLSPVLNERIADDASKYVVDHDAIKLYFAGLGEIDFIFCGPLIGGPTTPYALDARLPLESVTEVFAKKLYHRGNRITPRDVFDWWFVGTQAPTALDATALAGVLHDKIDGIDAELQRLQSVIRDPAAVLSPATAWAKIRSPYTPKQDEALDWARAYLSDLRGLCPTAGQSAPPASRVRSPGPR